MNGHYDYTQIVYHLAKSARPVIVNAGCGISNAEHVVNYLKVMLGSGRHDVLFVVCQAEDILGRDIQCYGPRNSYVVLDDEWYTIQAGVETIGGHLAHSDQQAEVDFCKGHKTKACGYSVGAWRRKANAVPCSELAKFLPDHGMPARQCSFRPAGPDQFRTVSF